MNFSATSDALVARYQRNNTQGGREVVQNNIRVGINARNCLLVAKEKLQLKANDSMFIESSKGSGTLLIGKEVEISAETLNIEGLNGKSVWIVALDKLTINAQNLTLANVHFFVFPQTKTSVSLLNLSCKNSHEFTCRPEGNPLTLFWVEEIRDMNFLNDIISIFPKEIHLAPEDITIPQ